MENLTKKIAKIKSKLPSKFVKSYAGKFRFQTVLSQNGLICQETLPIYKKNGEEIELNLKLQHFITEDSKLNFIELSLKLSKQIENISFQLKIKDFEENSRNIWNLSLQNVKNLEIEKSWKLQCNFPEGYFFKLGMLAINIFVLCSSFLRR